MWLGERAVYFSNLFFKFMRSSLCVEDNGCESTGGQRSGN